VQTQALHDILIEDGKAPRVSSYQQCGEGVEMRERLTPRRVLTVQVDFKVQSKADVAKALRERPLEDSLTRRAPAPGPGYPLVASRTTDPAVPSIPLPPPNEIETPICEEGIPSVVALNKGQGLDVYRMDSFNNVSDVPKGVGGRFVSERPLLLQDGHDGAATMTWEQFKRYSEHEYDVATKMGPGSGTTGLHKGTIQAPCEVVLANQIEEQKRKLAARSKAIADEQHSIYDTAERNRPHLEASVIDTDGSRHEFHQKWGYMGSEWEAARRIPDEASLEEKVSASIAFEYKDRLFAEAQKQKDVQVKALYAQQPLSSHVTIPRASAPLPIEKKIQVEAKNAERRNPFAAIREKEAQLRAELEAERSLWEKGEHPGQARNPWRKDLWKEHVLDGKMGSDPLHLYG